ncbi:MAG: DUF1398 family protein, partial [Steroidobacteraceae bacterium]
MNEQVKSVVREVTVASDGDRILFPDVVKALMSAGVERYHADLITATKTYYMPDGSFEVVRCDRPPAPAEAFSAQRVEHAVRSIQRKDIGYPEFCSRIAAAGCVGYFVTLAGRCAFYY